MSKPLVVSIPHHLGKDEAIRRIEFGLVHVQASFHHLLKIQEAVWIGDRLQFHVSAVGQGASGMIDVADDHVRLEVRLPWLISKFIEPLIRKEGILMLEKQ
jgi:hypothetical protein